MLMPLRSPLLALLLASSVCLSTLISAAEPIRPTAEAPKRESGEVAGHPYVIDLAMVPLEPGLAPLRQTLDRYTVAQRNAFLDKVQHAAPGHLQVPWKLSLEFSIAARTERFVSIVAFGDIEPGGASPSAIIDSFTYDTKAGRVISLPDLFTDYASAEAALANQARTQLLARLKPGKHHRPLASDATTVRSGTEIGKGRVRMFVPITHKDHYAHGLSLIFPTHQVAADTAGPLDVDVPTVVFARWLKPEYRDAFH